MTTRDDITIFLGGFRDLYKLYIYINTIYLPVLLWSEHPKGVYIGQIDYLVDLIGIDCVSKCVHTIYIICTSLCALYVSMLFSHAFCISMQVRSN